MNRIELRAPAKLNLGLRIRGRRADGYHELESLFVPLELADDLAIELREGSGIQLAVGGDAADGVPADARNLAWRAAEAYLREARHEARVLLTLTKRVPSPAGLGGGSSDAGAVLRGLAALTPGAVPLARMRELALRLGADVPFFLSPQPALVEGIGDRITPVSGVPALAVLLAHPGVGLSTQAVYAAFDAGDSLTPTDGPPNLRALLVLREEAGAAEARWPSSVEPLRALVVNDLEPAASRLSPLVTNLREELSAAGARAVGMSGSGPTMYAIYASEAEALIAQREIARRGTRTWVTSTARSSQTPR